MRGVHVTEKTDSTIPILLPAHTFFPGQRNGTRLLLLLEPAGREGHLCSSGLRFRSATRHLPLPVRSPLCSCFYLIAWGDIHLHEAAPVCLWRVNTQAHNCDKNGVPGSSLHALPQSFKISVFCSARYLCLHVRDAANSSFKR